MTIDLQHALCVLTTDNELYLCPAGKDGHQIHRALDAGCGTGIWTMDFGELSLIIIFFFLYTDLGLRMCNKY